MRKNIFILSTIFFLVVLGGLTDSSAQTTKKETTELEDIANNFKETKFLQVENLDVPKELKKIEEQIRQNAIDVVINSKTHTPVFAQKRPEGYSESYKKFHSLEIQIVSIPKEEDFYSLNFYYYNWTNRKVDKKFTVRISKYNVLNELRFGLYELFFGKQYIIEYKEEIEKQSFERIQAVRKAVEEQEKEERKKLKEKKKRDEENEALKAAREEEERARLEREELELRRKELEALQDPFGNEESLNAQRNSDSNSQGATAASNRNKNNQTTPPNNSNSSDRSANKDNNKNDNSEASSPSDELKNANNVGIPPAEASTPVTSAFYAFGSFFNDEVGSKGIIASTTNLRYIGFGARYTQEQVSDTPRGLRITIKAGMAIKKEDYKFPVYRAFETEMSRGKVLKWFKLFLGFDYSPVIFVNLPAEGEGLQVFENDIFWAKLGGAYSPVLFGKDLEIRAAFLKSLMVNSNQKKNFSGTSLVLSAYYQYMPKQALEFNYQQTYLVGDLDVEVKSVSLAYIYKFEN